MRIEVRRGLCCLLFVAIAVGYGPVLARAQPGALEAIQARGHVMCGVDLAMKGYAAVDKQNMWSGMSVDFCRALAAAVLGNKSAVKFEPLAATENQLGALREARVDALPGSLAMSSYLDTAAGVRFAGVLVHDGQGFLVRKSQNITSALELSGARICVATDRKAEPAIADYFGGLKMPVDLVKADRWADAVRAYATKSCQVLTGDQPSLALARHELTDAEEHAILPELAAKRAIGPVVRQGDAAWFGIVRWTLFALIAAEELGITAANADMARASGSPEARRFLGADRQRHKTLGLEPDWTLRIIRQVGNYGEMFERNLGQKSPLKLERRLNNLSGKGGLQFAPKFE
jgi:general L-amino acid transport system substrate-binding protein